VAADHRTLAAQSIPSDKKTIRNPLRPKFVRIPPNPHRPGPQTYKPRRWRGALTKSDRTGGSSLAATSRRGGCQSPSSIRRGKPNPSSRLAVVGDDRGRRRQRKRRLASRPRKEEVRGEEDETQTRKGRKKFINGRQTARQRWSSGVCFAPLCLRLFPIGQNGPVNLVLIGPPFASLLWHVAYLPRTGQAAGSALDFSARPPRPHDDVLRESRWRVPWSGGPACRWCTGARSSSGGVRLA
jgi:hypothetical protein